MEPLMVLKYKNQYNFWGIYRPNCLLFFLIKLNNKNNNHHHSTTYFILFVIIIKIIIQYELFYYKYN